MMAVRSKDCLVVCGVEYRIWDLRRLAREADIDLGSVPFSGRVLLELLLRTGEHAAAVAGARRLAVGADIGLEVGFLPARLLLQDYTGVPSLVDLAAMRDRVRELGGEPARVNPVVTTDVVVDHSLQVDAAGEPGALAWNEMEELRRNRERYSFLRWAEQAFSNLRISPPGQGIVHQVNLERLASVVSVGDVDGSPVLVPDTVIGTDSHTTMVNGLGVLGWGVGGLEAEALMLGLPVRTLVPPIVGVRLTGRAGRGITAADLVLALTEYLRGQDVVGAWVEFTGPAVPLLTAPDRCTIANMAPEYGAMCAFFPVDLETLDYLRRTGRAPQAIERVEAYCRRQALLRDEDAPSLRFGRLLEFDLGCVEPSVAGPSMPHQRLAASRLGESFHQLRPAASMTPSVGLSDGAIVIAAITSCTHTSNPAAMVAAGLLAKRAVERGLRVPSHVKTSLAPGSRAVTRYLGDSGLLTSLEVLGFHVVGYGCATCNGGSGPLKPGVSEAIERDGLTVAAVLSGNRNFEGRIHPQVRANYLASPPLVVALALAGNIAIDVSCDPLGVDSDGKPVVLAELWPDDAEIASIVAREVCPDVFNLHEDPSETWSAIEIEAGPRFRWRDDSTYIQKPPYFEATVRGASLSGEARALLVLGDNVTTDHISPVGAIPRDSPAGRYLMDRGVLPQDFNSYGARRGNHEVMARAAFASARIENQLVPGVEGGVTVHLTTGDRLSIYDAAQRYAAEGTPLIVFAGRSYGMGSSRDWAARGPWFLGVRAVLAVSFERIHRANLVAMGILPIELPPGKTLETLGLNGHEHYTLESENGTRAPRGAVHVRARSDGGRVVDFDGTARIDSEGELEIYHRGGMLPYLLDCFRAVDGAGGDR